MATDSDTSSHGAEAADGAGASAPNEPGRPGTARRGRSRRRGWIAAIVAAAGLLVVRLTGWAESLVYYPSGPEFSTPPYAEDVRFPGPDGATLHGWWIAAKPVAGGAGALGSDGASARRAPTVVHTHGNAGAIPEHAAFVRWLADAGYNVLLFDYRGYGKSDAPAGPIRRHGAIADSAAAVDYVMSRPDVDPRRVAVLGFSLGATMGANAAAQRPGVRAVVLAAGFSSWQGVAKDYAWWLGPMLMPPGGDAVDAVAALGDRPLLLVHGDADGIVHVRHAAILQAAASGAGVRVEQHIEPGADHNTLLTGFPAVRGVILAFLAEHLADGPAGPRAEPGAGSPADADGAAQTTPAP